MGILVTVEFQTPEGFPITQVYARIVHMTHDLISKITVIKYNCYLSRSTRLDGRNPVAFPFLPDVIAFPAVAFPTVDMLYYHLKKNMTREGLVVEDVLEEGQSLSTYSEPEPEPPAPASLPENPNETLPPA